MATRTTLTSAVLPQKPRGRGLWIVGPVVVAAAVLFAPSLVVKPSEQPALLLLGQVVVAGVVLGAGRQGLDLLGLRMGVSSLAVPLGWWAGGATNHPACTGLQSCFQWVALGVVLLAVLVALVLALVAVPMTILWNRGLGSLHPELPWSRLPRPRRWWQWGLLAMGVVIGLIALQFALGIDSP